MGEESEEQGLFEIEVVVLKITDAVVQVDPRRLKVWKTVSPVMAPTAESP